MTDSKEFLLQIHYYLQDSETHSVDAFLHNKYESYLLRAISEVSKVSGCDDVKVILNLSEEGGWKDNIRILFEGGIFGILLQTFLASHFSPAVDKNTDTRNLIETAIALKEGDFTEEEAMALLEGNEKLVKFASLYYKNVEKDNSILKIETTLKGSGDSPQPFLNCAIERGDFNSHVIRNIEKKRTEILSTTIYIISPLLVNVKSMKWRGKFNGDNIAFSIADNDFITQVMNREVKFDAGTSITCDLFIDETTTMLGNKTKTKRTYIVSRVISWADGSHVNVDGRRYANLQDQ